MPCVSQDAVLVFTPVTLGKVHEWQSLCRDVHDQSRLLTRASYLEILRQTVIQPARIVSVSHAASRDGFPRQVFAALMTFTDLKLQHAILPALQPEPGASGHFWVRVTPLAIPTPTTCVDIHLNSRTADRASLPGPSLLEPVPHPLSCPQVFHFRSIISALCCIVKPSG